MHSITPGTCMMMLVKLGMQKVPFSLSMDHQKGRPCIPTFLQGVWPQAFWGVRAPGHSAWCCARRRVRPKQARNKNKASLFFPRDTSKNHATPAANNMRKKSRKNHAKPCHDELLLRGSAASGVSLLNTNARDEHSGHGRTKHTEDKEQHPRAKMIFAPSLPYASQGTHWEVKDGRIIPGGHGKHWKLRSTQPVGHGYSLDRVSRQAPCSVGQPLFQRGLGLRFLRLHWGVHTEPTLKLRSHLGGSFAYAERKCTKTESCAIVSVR